MKVTLSDRIKSVFNKELRAVIQDPFHIGSIANPSEDLQYAAVRMDEKTISMISNPCERALKYVLMQNPYFIKWITNPSEKMQVIAVHKEPDTIALIEEPCLKAKFACVYSNPEKIRDIKNPDSELQIYAIQHSPELISELENPCETAQLIAVLNAPQTIFDIRNPCARAMLFAIEKLTSTRIFPSDSNMEIISEIVLRSQQLKELGADYKDYFKKEILNLNTIKI